MESNLTNLFMRSLNNNNRNLKNKIFYFYIFNWFVIPDFKIFSVGIASSTQEIKIFDNYDAEISENHLPIVLKQFKSSGSFYIKIAITELPSIENKIYSPEVIYVILLIHYTIFNFVF